ncbi:MAG: DUF2851 domain-containing protein [Verrucomicrobia bacterium]|nr:MAG: DUF2851 domain-containing protein [Verrucomicrobiota bacterium]
MKPSNEKMGHRKTDRLEEFQGLYGPYQVAERLVQKIWLRGEFDTARLLTLSGKPVRIINTGEWNRLGGPDFLSADLEIDGCRVAGDVEIHFREVDWTAHRHHLDPAYDNVVLHVVLFPPPVGHAPIRTHRGHTIETVVLIDLLWHDLEEYAFNDAAAAASGMATDQALERLVSLSADERREHLFECARTRWNQKVQFAGIRIKKLGFEGACHSTSLEVLGYSRNRAAMLAVADRYPIAVWSDLDLAEVLGRPDIHWRRQGVRPANQPKHRLAQYAHLACDGRAWIDRLKGWSDHPDLASGRESPTSVREVRKRLGLSRLRRELLIGVLAEAVPGPRADTLVVDGLLPILASHSGKAYFEPWFAWVPGDIPLGHREILRRAGIGGLGVEAPHAHGWFQGLLGLMIDLRANG